MQLVIGTCWWGFSNQKLGAASTEWCGLLVKCRSLKCYQKRVLAEVKLWVQVDFMDQCVRSHKKDTDKQSGRRINFAVLACQNSQTMSQSVQHTKANRNVFQRKNIFMAITPFAQVNLKFWNQITVPTPTTFLFADIQKKTPLTPFFNFLSLLIWRSGLGGLRLKLLASQG